MYDNSLYRTKLKGIMGIARITLCLLLSILKNDFDYDVLDNACVSTPDFEIIGIRLKIGNIKPFHVFGTYRPPTGSMIKYLDKLGDVIEGIDLVRIELFSIGNTNIDYKKTKLLRSLKVRNFETKCNLRQLVTVETRVTQTTSTIIDWIYTSAIYISISGVLNYNISDHLPTFLVRKKSRNKICKIAVRGRSYLRYNENDFQNALEDADWETFDSSNNPIENGINLKKILIQVLIACAHSVIWLYQKISQNGLQTILYSL